MFPIHTTLVRPTLKDSLSRFRVLRLDTPKILIKLVALVRSKKELGVLTSLLRKEQTFRPSNQQRRLVRCPQRPTAAQPLLTCMLLAQGGAVQEF